MLRFRAVKKGRRDETGRPGGDARLVYSTGGEPPKPPPRTAGGGAALRAAPGKGVRVRLEKRPGGRDITTVLGLVGPAAHVEALARDLRAACGAGGTIRGGVIELQGDQVDKARAFLEGRGIKAR